MVTKTLERALPMAPVENDADSLAAAARMSGEDMCSIADLSSGEVRAILKLGHDVKRNPRDYRHALDAKQMVLMFEKASLRTRMSFEAGINTMGGNTAPLCRLHTNSPLGERESISDVARNVEHWVDVIMLRTYAHDTITEDMASNARVPVINALSGLRASLPGPGRLHDLRRALWFARRPELYLRATGDSNGDWLLTDAHGAAAWRECHDRDSAQLLVQILKLSQS